MTAERQDKGSDWAHAFRLPDGSRVGTVKAKGNKNALKLSVLQAVVRPGMRVVDIGSAEGLFAFYAAEAGASEVLGLDIMSERITRANDVSARLGMADRVVFRHADVAKDGDPSERGGGDETLRSCSLSSTAFQIPSRCWRRLARRPTR